MDALSLLEKAKSGNLVLPACEIPGFGKVFDDGFFRIEKRDDGGLNWYWFETESEANEPLFSRSLNPDGTDPLKARLDELFKEKTA